MGAEKKGTKKSGGFFHLFDLNKKSRKKLFSNSTFLPDNSKHEKKSDNSSTSARFCSDKENEIVGVSSIKESSDYSCASSITDEGFSSRPPGVVARLMGLDSMPTSSSSEPSSTPFLDSPFVHKNSYKRTPDFCIADQFTNIPYRTESYSRKPMELRSQRMPSSPIDRFQTETIPPKSPKLHPLAHNKLFSPVKNAGFISGRNAAHIMEEAAKILDPRPQPSARSKVSSSPLKSRDTRQNLMATQYQKTTNSTKTPSETNDAGYLRVKSVNRLSGSEFDDVSSSVAKNKGKSISLAIQAKENVQKREALSLPQGDHECRVNVQKTTRNPATAKSSCALKQTNQKQNSLSDRSKLSPKQPLTNQNSRRVVSGHDATSMRNNTVNKPSGNLGIVHRKLEKDEKSPTDRDLPRKKRLIERGLLDNVNRDRYQKNVQPNFVMGEGSYLRWAQNSRSDGSDVVSFTFTSPLIKSTSKMASSIQKDCSDGTEKKTSSRGLDVITGDALSILLEQKLRELTSGLVTSDCSFVKADSSSAFSSVIQEPMSDFHSGFTSTAETERNKAQKHVFHPGVPSTSGLVFGISKLQRTEDAECSSSSNARKETKLQNLSPLSTLDFLSYGSLISTDSSGSSKGGSKKNTPPEVEMELLDSASSTLTEISNLSELARSQSQSSNELDYVKEVSSHWSLVHSETLDPLLFDKLETQTSINDKNAKMRRKLLFDCVNECLNTKCCRYFRAGYKSWSKGMGSFSDKLPDDIYEDISRWKSIGECMIDELLEKDMSTHRGKWMDFEIEAFETGREIENDIFNSLLDEMMAD